MTFTLADAYRLAERAHAGQTDKAGRPYVLHPLAVAESLAEHGEQAQIAGMLHDVIEDTPVTADDLLAAGVEPDTVEAVLAVTRREGETYADFVRRAASHPIGRLVKRADIAHNTDPERLAALDPRQAASLTRKYAQALAILDAAPG
ncbi:(p)ppGpp synthase/HD superfamily hydrolase [Thermocatellispora tengchongensis]|uniref:(P)ppGpp synthase/HD superfamily hydrolase n=1 Tax=Thermocatellispora tengchongensis TaxID=1073253 RepID=A0A840P9Q8_9ACTN|nr:HD domain-containing protein [Thermocatellispora tengchongensis]MBB5136388.1 (p)ppGpp synthase/HD superfamily hydrolase [Thermocatellispora tengchongensis]